MGSNNVFYLGPVTYMNAISYGLFGFQIDRSPGIQCMNEIRRQIENCKYISTFREEHNYRTILYRGPSITFDKVEMYKSEKVTHWHNDPVIDNLPPEDGALVPVESPTLCCPTNPSEKVHIVIARYNENIDWLIELLNTNNTWTATVYNDGSEITNKHINLNVLKVKLRVRFIKKRLTSLLIVWLILSWC